MKWTQIAFAVYIVCYCAPLLVEILLYPRSYLLALCAIWTGTQAVLDCLKIYQLGMKHFYSKWNLCDVLQTVVFCYYIHLRHLTPALSPLVNPRYEIDLK